MDYEVFKFWQAKKEEDETTDQFVTRLRTELAAYCEFGDLDRELKFILGQSSDKSKTPVVSVTINGVSTEMIVDTGASTNVLDEVTF